MISRADRKGAEHLRAAKRAPRRGRRTSLTSTTSATRFRGIFSCCWSISWVLWIEKLPNCQWPLYPSCDWYQTLTFCFSPFLSLQSHTMIRTATALFLPFLRQPRLPYVENGGIVGSLHRWDLYRWEFCRSGFYCMYTFEYYACSLVPLWFLADFLVRARPCVENTGVEHVSVIFSEILARAGRLNSGPFWVTEILRRQYMLMAAPGIPRYSSACFIVDVKKSWKCCPQREQEGSFPSWWLPTLVIDT